MSKDSGAGKETTPDLAAAGQRLLEDVKSEPVPETLIDLARQLEVAIAKKREDAAKKSP
jgi:hypothetical protein